MRRNEYLDLENFDLASLPPPVRGERLVRDAIRPNLALRLRASGARTWIVFSTKNGKTVRRTLGNAHLISVSSARAIADATDHDPSATDSGPASISSPFPPDATLAEALPRYLAFGARSRWKASTGRQMECVGRLYILPFFGVRPIRDLGPQDVAAWYAEVQLLGTSSRMALSTLSGLMRFAEDHGLRKTGSNPCRGLRKKERSGRGRLLPDRDIRLLWQMLERQENEMLDACDAVRLLLLTGARKREILDLRWEQIVGCRAVLVESKSGPRTVWLNTSACSILDRRKISTSGKWVFPAKRRSGSISSIDRQWRCLLAEAGIPPMRLHDLRHHFAAIAVSNGIDLKFVGQLLGHADIDSTLEYAHLATSALTKSASRVSGLIDRSLKEKPAWGPCGTSRTQNAKNQSARLSKGNGHA